MVSKNIVVYSDGTGQDGGIRPEQRVSNIYKMYRTSRVSFDSGVDPSSQVTMYDPGLGTDVGATGMTAPVRFLQKLLSSVDGRGITDNIVDCYKFIIDHYQPGDRIFLFGFSRGAYTVRSVADLLRLCGVPTITPTGPVLRFRAQTRKIAEEATLTVLEHGAGHPRDKFEAERDELARRFRDKYGSHHDSGEEQRSNVAPYFIGVFDTVAALGANGFRRFMIQTGLTALIALAGFVVAVLGGILGNTIFDWPFWSTVMITEALIVTGGIVWLAVKQRRSFRKAIVDFPKKGDRRSHLARWEGKNFNRLLSRFVTYARSANAIDETRADFDRVPWGPTLKGPDETAGIKTFRQVFFAGNHSDVGGSYAEVESRLSDIALEWMLREAVSVPNGLSVGPVYVNGKLMVGTGAQGAALYLHPADGGPQHCEIWGMRDYLDTSLPRLLAPFLKNQNYVVNTRNIPEGAEVHPSVRRRFDLSCVQHADGSKAYRPKALAGIKEFESYYRASES